MYGKIPNLSRLRSLPEDQQKAALRGMVAFGLKLPHMAIDMLGAKAPLVFRNGESRMKAAHGGAVAMPTDAEIKAYLTGDGAAKFFGAKWAVPGDNPQLTDVANAFNQFFHELPALDLGYQSLYDFVDMRGSSETTFEVINSALGITWSRIDGGGNLKPNREISEGSVAVPYLTYGAALGIQDDWFRYNKFYLVEDAVREFQAKYFAVHSNVHYGLLTALGAGVNTAFATNDQQTLNNAAATIARAMEPKGYASASMQFDIVTSPEQVGRILLMLEARQGSAFVAMQNRQPIAWTVRNVIASTRITAGDTGYYLVLPGLRMKRGQWLDPTLESDRVASAAATDWYARSQFNAVIADSAQVRRVLFA
jgi:hypothetical protein